MLHDVKSTHFCYISHKVKRWPNTVGKHVRGNELSRKPLLVSLSSHSWLPLHFPIMGIDGHYNLNCWTIISGTSLSCLPHINQTTHGAAWDFQWLYLSKMSPQHSLVAYSLHMDTKKFLCYFLQRTHVILSPNNHWITTIHQAHNACRRISQVSHWHRANQAAGCLAKWDIPYHLSGDLHSCVKAGISWKHLWVSLQQRQSKQSFSVHTDSWQGSIWCQGQLYKPKTDSFSFLQISSFVISWSQHGCRRT